MRKSIAFLLVLTMVLSLGLSFGASIEDLEKQMEEKEANIADKQAELEGVQSEHTSVEAAYWAAVEEIEILKERISQTALEIEDKGEEIEITQEELEEALEEYNFQAEEFGGRLRTMYLTKDESFWSMIFKAEGFEDLLMRIANYRRIVKMDEETLEKLEEQRLALEEIQAELEDEMQELKVLKEQQEVDKIALDEKAVELDERKAELADMASDISDQIAAEEAAGYEIQGQIDHLVEQARLAAEAARREQERLEQERLEQERLEQEREQANNSDDSYESDDSYDSPSYEEPDRGPSYVGGAWYWPTPGYYYVSYGFGNRVHPLYGTANFHNGIDILGDHGAPIVAARSGLVSYAGWMSGYGNTVIIDHGDGMQSLYAHGSSIAAGYAQFVNAGDYIMAMGSTGVSTANHLHFGIMSGGVWVNPSAYVGG